MATPTHPLLELVLDDEVIATFQPSDFVTIRDWTRWKPSYDWDDDIDGPALAVIQSVIAKLENA